MEQKDIIEFQLMSNELQQVHEFLRGLDEQVMHVNKLVEDLEAFAKLKPGDEVLFPIANGLFAKGTLSDAQKLQVNVGQGVVVPRSVEETIQLINEQSAVLVEQQRIAVQRQEEIYEKLEALEKKVSEQTDV